MKQEKLLRYHLLWLLIGCLLVSLVVYFSLIPKTPVNLHSIKYGDKLSHFLAYGMLMGWFAQIYSNHFKKSLILAGLILTGVLLEFIQAYGGIRTWSIGDMLANTFGAVFAYIMTYGRLGGILLWVEKKILLPPSKQG